MLPPTPPIPAAPPGRTYAHAWTALVLTALAGAVDGAGFLALNQQFVANQTGNAVVLAVALSGEITGRGGPSPVGPLWSLIGFALGTVLASLATRRHVLTSFGMPGLLVAEVIVLALAGAAGGQFGLAVGLAAFAMGVQSIHAARIGLSGVTTTVLTGTLIALSVNLSGDREDLRSARLQAWVWGVYLLGAGFGSALAYETSFGAVCWIAAAVAALMAVAGYVEDRYERRKAQARKALLVTARPHSLPTPPRPQSHQDPDAPCPSSPRPPTPRSRPGLSHSPHPQPQFRPGPSPSSFPAPPPTHPDPPNPIASTRTPTPTPPPNAVRIGGFGPQTRLTCNDPTRKGNRKREESP